MKCTVIIDRDREEEIVAYLHERRGIAEKLTALAESESVELIGYSDNGSIVKLTSSEIFAVFVEDGKVYAVTEREKLQLRQRLYVLEELLGTGFVKIHQSCLVNTETVDRFDASIGGALLVILKNGYKDYVSRRQLKAVKERMGFKL